jgi:arsenate reductase
VTHAERGANPSRGGPAERLRVLFVCTHNSARSQIAEALLRRLGGDRYEASSAGSEPSGVVNELALEIIREIGGDPSAHRSKGLDEVLDSEWDLVVTVCDDAREACPVLPTRVAMAHWGLPDPSQVKGTRDERLAAFRSTQRALTSRIERLVAEAPGEIERLGSRD